MTLYCPLLPYEIYHFASVTARVAIHSPKDPFWDQKADHYRARNIIKCDEHLGVKKTPGFVLSEHRLANGPQADFVFLLGEIHSCASDLYATWSGWMGLKHYVCFSLISFPGLCHLGIIFVLG